jgi:hypothetical protein
MKENRRACLLSALQQTLDSAATFWMLIYLTSNNRAKIYTIIYSTVHNDFDMEYSVCEQEHNMLSSMHNGLHTCKWAE